MKHVKVIGWASILFLLIFTSCREDLLPTTTDVVTLEEPMIRVEASLKGQVIDENNQPIENAIVKLNDTEIQTDENGIYKFENAVLNQNGTLVTAKKSGYFLGAKLFNPTLGAESFVPFQLLAKELTGSFETTNGGKLTTIDGASVEFGANAIRTDAGDVYSGEVRVFAKWIDPTSDMLAEQMPGDLRAWDKNEVLVQLATYGMVAVELESPTGVKLQLKEGNLATLTMPVPQELLSNAPNSIPLWSMNEETGYWIEESSATLQDGMYVGEVSHFSFWNCDAPFPLVKMTFQLKDEEGNPMKYMKVTIETDNISARTGYSNSEGIVCGKVPKGQDLILNVFDYCGNVIHSQNLGSHDGDFDLGTIVVENVNATFITGELDKCDGTPVTEGYLFVKDLPMYYTIDIDENGAFSSYIFVCESFTGSIIAFDTEVPLKSDEISITIDPTGGNLDLGTIVVCETITEFIKVTIPSLGYEKLIFSYSIGSSASGGTYIGSEIDSIYFNFYFDEVAPTTGIVQLTGANYAHNASPIIGNNYFYCGNNISCGELDITTNDGVGGAFVGTFTGELDDEISQVAFGFVVEFSLLYD